MTSNAVQRPQTPGALRVVAAWARLLCSASSTMTRHRLDRRALHPGPRRSQRDPRDFHHGLLGLRGEIKAGEGSRCFASSTTTNAEIVRNPRLPDGWRLDGLISLSLLLHYGKAWRSSSLRELHPSRSPQTLQYLCCSVLKEG